MDRLLVTTGGITAYFFYLLVFLWQKGGHLPLRLRYEHVSWKGYS